MISIIVPCFNESDHIERSLQSILAQEPPPGGFEIIVADGLSNDGTRDVLHRLAEQHPHLRIVDNVDRVTPHGINVGIREARGRWVVIMGAHTEYAPDYIRTCLGLLEEHPEVCCSGGPILARGKSLFGRAVAAAMAHPMGVGNAKHRFPDFEGYAEGACFPMFRKEIFDKIGLYDGTLIRNQDDELNYRLAIHGEKVFISPRARCIYYVRETPSQLFRQYFEYGFWRVAVLKKHRLPASFRQIVPPAFISIMILLLTLGLLLEGLWRVIAIVLPIIYGVVLLSAAAAVAYKQGRKAGFLFPIAAAIMHLAYATGFIWRVIKRGNSQTKNMSYSTGGIHASGT